MTHLFSKLADEGQHASKKIRANRKWKDKYKDKNTDKDTNEDKVKDGEGESQRVACEWMYLMRWQLCVIKAYANKY